MIRLSYFKALPHQNAARFLINTDSTKARKAGRAFRSIADMAGLLAARPSRE
jgi:hypothetical protein